MNVLIIEDEALAAARLEKMIKATGKNISVLAKLESVEESIEWLKNNNHPDIIFLDIHLEDDLCFAIFDKVKVDSSVIFTTAFDEYAIRAFKLKSIDYLLKPIVQNELNAALDKYEQMRLQSSGKTGTKDLDTLYSLIMEKEKSFKERFSVKVGQKIKTFLTREVAFFRSEGGVTDVCLHDGTVYFVDQSLSTLEGELDPTRFFRINRQMLVSLSAIKDVHIISGSRLKLELAPNREDRVYVSLDKTTAFKKWLDGAPDNQPGQA